MHYLLVCLQYVRVSFMGCIIFWCSFNMFGLVSESSANIKKMRSHMKKMRSHMKKMRSHMKKRRSYMKKGAQNSIRVSVSTEIVVFRCVLNVLGLA